VADECDDCDDDPQKSDPGVCGCGSSDVDSDADSQPDCIDADDDGDGVEDDEDASPMDRFRCQDSDRDGCDDCSSGWWDPAGDGPDADGDGACNVGDCAPEDPAVLPAAHEVNDGRDNNCPGDPGYGLVDEISGLAGFLTPFDKEEFSWPVQPGAVWYHAVRSVSPTFPGGCAQFELPDPFWHDPAVPVPGGAFYYLVRAASPHPGSWGTDSYGVERTGLCP
jgi:hypothetical protein